MATPDDGRRRTWRFRLNDKETLEVSTPPRATEKQVRRRGRVSLVLGALISALVVSAVAYADDVYNDLDASIDATAETLSLSYPGANGTVGLAVEPRNGDGKNGCNLTGSTTLVVSVASSNTAVATVSPSSITFGSCGDTPSITVTPLSAGSSTVTLTQTSNNTGGSFDLTPATFTVQVTAAPPSDSTPPVITPNIVGTLGTNGWYTSNVTVSWSVVDTESAISSSSGCGLTTITSDTAGTTLTCSATSAGGTASESVTIKRDATAPTISGSASPVANANGWNNTNVAVTFTCSDATSGVASCGPNQTLSSEGANQSASGTAVDNAGNTAGATVIGINIDKTAPTVSLVGGPEDGGSYYFGSVPAAPTCSASDALSGLAGACSVSGYSDDVGSRPVTASATDLAGNTGTASNAYTVLAWTLSGFFRPVEMGDSVLNTVKGGSTVPLKFRVFAGTTELTDTSVVESLKATPVACTGGTEDPVEDLSPTGGTSLRYDTTDGQFIYNWQTPKKPGTCYRVTLTTDDGSTIVANFKLK